MSRLLKCTAQYDGTTFEGVGPTKNIAKVFIYRERGDIGLFITLVSKVL